MKLPIKNSFTLIEVMVVVTIVCIIGAMMVPILSKKTVSTPKLEVQEVFYQTRDSLHVYSFVYSNRTYLVSSQGGLIEVRKDE